ncbi:hypothetical protein QF042_001921 [Pedobacter sp. W3I1]|uniref:hypothetical protein n=1 Tax=Pedobacter sp. W3I1 TaxID=3042291 RepID=UPI00277F6092|nr:hypothetical protein [Pedobacter sp. W3I1]MDQ0638356.1 hypothetical protein [Pedobacter sp. W3I1]
MKQMNVSEEKRVGFDFSRFRLPQCVSKLHPLLFKEGNTYFAVLGPDPQSGIFGCGDTPEDALMDWNDHLRESLRNPDPNNQVIQYVIKTLHPQRTEIWEGR